MGVSSHNSEGYDGKSIGFLLTIDDNTWLPHVKTVSIVKVKQH